MVAERLEPTAAPLLEAPASAAAQPQPAISGRRKAAILVAALGEEERAGILRLLAADQVRDISRQIGGMAKVMPVERASVLAEFTECLANPEQLTGGPDFATSLLVAAFGPSDGKRMAAEVLNPGSSTTPHLDRLRAAQPEAIARVLHREQPQLIALLLSQLSRESASTVLTHLPADLRSPVTKRIAALGRVAPSTVERLAEMVRLRLGVVADAEAAVCGGSRAVAELMNRIDPEASEKILEEIGDEDPDLCHNIRSLMFVFEDLLTLNQESLRKVMAKVDKKVLTLAMKGCSPKLKAHVNSIMSSRAAEMLTEDMHALGPVRIRDVEQAQQKIVELVLQLKSEGVVNVAGGGEADQLVE